MQQRPQLSVEQRHRLLDRVLAQRLSRRGWRLEFYSEVDAIIVRGGPVDHVLHAILTVLTAVWLIVWLSEIAFGGERREVVYIDQHGNIRINRLH